MGSFTTGSPLNIDDDIDIDAFFAEINTYNMDDLVDESAGNIPPDPQSLGHILPDQQSAAIANMRHAVLYEAGLVGATAATGAEHQHEQNSHSWSGPCVDWILTSPGLTVTEPDTYPIGNAGALTGTGTAELSVSGFINGVLNSTAAVKDILPTPPVDNAGLAMPEPDPYSTGGSSSCPSTTADMGISSSPDLEVTAGARLLPSGGGDGALTEAPVRRSTPPESNSNLVEYNSRRRYQSDPDSADRRPPAGSNDIGIIDFLRLEEISMAPGDQVNLSLAEQDQMAPKAVRSYVTTVEMVPYQKTHHGYWKEKQVISLRETATQWWTKNQVSLRQVGSFGTFKSMNSSESNNCKLIEGVLSRGLKRTFQFHRFDGTKTNWFMHEYITTDVFGGDLFMKGLRFREVYEQVYEGAQVLVQGEPTSPDVKKKNKTAAVKKHRMRGPENLVINGESPAWHHFIKIYDRHPELEGSKVVYAVCCHCEVVLKAGTENGTKNLLTHCNRTCREKNKKQQPSLSSSNSSTGDTSCLSTAVDTGSSSLDQDFNAGAGLPQSGGDGDGGGCTLAEAPVQASCKRQKLICGSSSQRSVPPESILVELLADLVQSDPSSTDIKPPTGSTDIEIIRFLKREGSLMPPHGKEVNQSLGEQDQMSPEAVQSYITTVKMMPDQNLQDLGYWKEKQVKLLRKDESDGIGWSLCCGLKRTFQFHMDDGTETNWFMYEYVPTDQWGHDLFMKPLRFRKVYEGVEVPEVKIKNKIAAGKKHRMRGPENLVIERESPAWQHFIKVYDRHPELEGAKVVYAVCCHCEGVLKAGTDSGTKSLLTHCDRTCRVKNKKQQPSSSSHQENHFGVLVGVGVP